MADTKFTPGPWRLRDEDGPPITDVMVGDRLLATAYPDHFKSGNPYKGLSHDILRSYAEAEANARLIAAAPELLEAAELILVVADYAGNSWAKINAAIKAARTAVAKARGEG